MSTMITTATRLLGLPAGVPIGYHQASARVRRVDAGGPTPRTASVMVASPSTSAWAGPDAPEAAVTPPCDAMNSNVFTSDALATDTSGTDTFGADTFATATPASHACALETDMVIGGCVSGPPAWRPPV